MKGGRGKQGVGRRRVEDWSGSGAVGCLAACCGMVWSGLVSGAVRRW
jgi:hypothetical protein